MMRKPYTENEIILCIFIARFEGALLNEKKIARFGRRSEASIRAKIGNIAAMLDVKGIARNPVVTPLSGVPAGEGGRETDWLLVESLLTLDKAMHFDKCRAVLLQESSNNRFGHN